MRAPPARATRGRKLLRICRRRTARGLGRLSSTLIWRLPAERFLVFGVIIALAGFSTDRPRVGVVGLAWIAICGALIWARLRLV